MATQTMEAELLDLETRYWQAIKDKDVDTAMRLTDFPCLIAGSTGIRSVDQQSFKKIMSGAAYTLHRFEIKDEAQVRILGDDMAAVAYQIHQELTVDGKPVALDAADTSIWVRRDGRWVCAVHTETVAGDPYGRDRRA
jgi:ketosteroid isomerase-like protein